MAQIIIADDVCSRVMAFKPLVESGFEVTLEDNAYLELLLRMVPDLLLSEVFGGAEGRAMLTLIQQMGQAQPATYGLLASILEQDEHKALESQQRASVRQRLGFPEPEKLADAGAH